MLWLSGWRSARRAAAVVASACALGCLSVLFLLAVFLVIGPAFGDVGAALPWALALAVVVGGGLGAAGYLIWVPWSGERAGVVVDETRVTIRHPGLGAPLVVPRDQVAGVALEPVGDEVPLLTLWGRLAWPNLALLFTAPVRTVPPPRAVRAGQYFHRLWCGGGAVHGVQCRIEDEGAAQRTFAQWLR